MVWLASWLWQGVALALLTALVLHTSRAVNAATRYALWWLPLLAVVSYPVVTSVAPWLLNASLDPAAGPIVPEQTLFSFTVPHLPSWVLAVGAIGWLVAVLRNAVRLAIAIRGVRELRRSATPIDGRVEAALPLWRDASSHGRPTRVFISDTATVPVALGLGRPLVIVPRRLLGTLAPHDLDQIIVHEHAHLQRYDDWGRFLQIVVELLVPFHPALRWMASRLDLEREIASDDWVIARTGQPAAYARCLTRLAEQLTPSTAPALTPAVLRRRTQMLSRVERLLDPSRNARPRISTWAAVALAIVMVSLSGRAERLLGIHEAGMLNPVEEVAAQEATPSAGGYDFHRADIFGLSLPRLDLGVAAQASTRTPSFSAIAPERMDPVLRRPIAYRPLSALRADAPDDDGFDEARAAQHDLDDRRQTRRLRPISLAFDRIAAGSPPPDDLDDPDDEDDDYAPLNLILALDTNSLSGLDQVHHPDLPFAVREGLLAPSPLLGASRKPPFFSRVGRSVARLFGVHVRSPGHLGPVSKKKSRSEAPKRAGRSGRQATPVA